MGTYAKGNKFITKVTVPASYDVRGRVSRMTATREAGESWELACQAAIKLGKPLPEPEGATVKTVGGGDAGTMANVLRSAQKLHWANLKDPKGDLNAQTFVNWVGPNQSPSQALSQDTIERFVTVHLMEERKVSGSTINRYLSAIGVLEKFAGKQVSEKIDRTILWRKENEGRIRWFSDEEEALVIQTLTLWAKEDERDLFVFCVDTGARPFAEAATAPWRDFANRKVTFWDTKNGKSRTVPITTRAWEAVQRMKARKSNQLGPFTDVDKDGIDKLWNRVRLHLPQLADTVFYTARHTCCSRLVQRGADLRRVMDWMGHKNIATTMRYAHLAPSHLMDVAHLLEGPALKVVGG
jgi:integrase